MLVALGMTAVIATGGIDLSVGALVAISRRDRLPDHQPARRRIEHRRRPRRDRRRARADARRSASGTGSSSPIVGIQPIVATLILMVAGRGLAQLITSGQIITINSSPYELLGNGYWLALPFALFVVAAMYGVSGTGRAAGPRSGC